MKIGRIAGCIVLASVLALVGLAFGVVPAGAQHLQACNNYTNPNCPKPPKVVTGHPPSVATGKQVTGFGGTAPGAPNGGPVPVAGKAPVVTGANPTGKPVSTLPNTGGAFPSSNSALPAILLALAMLALAGIMRLWGTERASTRNATP